jgi:uncharacterized membrane protein
MAERTESSIVIAAPAADVLDVIADLDQYPQWAGDVRDVEIIAEDGDGWPDQARLVFDAGVIKEACVFDYEWDIVEDGTGVVSWSLVEASTLKAMNGSYTLEAVDGGTQVTYRLAVELTIPMLGTLRRKAEKVIVESALRNLKAHVEG